MPTPKEQRSRPVTKRISQLLNPKQRPLSRPKDQGDALVPFMLCTIVNIHYPGNSTVAIRVKSAHAHIGSGNRSRKRIPDQDRNFPPRANTRLLKFGGGSMAYCASSSKLPDRRFFYLAYDPFSISVAASVSTWSPNAMLELLSVFCGASRASFAHGRELRRKHESSQQ